MIKQQARQNVGNKDELVEEMVSSTYKRMREMGQFETVYEIFGKLPISRIQKEQYQFLFDSVRQNVEEIINQQDTLHKILEKEAKTVNEISIKSYKDKENHSRILDQSDFGSNGVIALSNYDFDHLTQNCFNEKLASGRPIFKSVFFLRHQEYSKSREMIGESPFLPDQHYIDFNAVKHQIGDVRLLLEDEAPLKQFDLQFADENKVEFKSRNFPNRKEMEKRASTLAKLYLLHLYREEGRKAKLIYKSNEQQLNKQRQIRKIKQEMDIEKVKEGEMIEEMDLVKQVYKILGLIQKKMNELAFAQFQNKNGDKAAQIKRSLQKIKKIVHQQSSARNKLKILITYKHRKGW